MQKLEGKVGWLRQLCLAVIESSGMFLFCLVYHKEDTEAIIKFITHFSQEENNLIAQKRRER